MISYQRLQNMVILIANRASYIYSYIEIDLTGFVTSKSSMTFQLKRTNGFHPIAEVTVYQFLLSSKVVFDIVKRDQVKTMNGIYSSR